MAQAKKEEKKQTDKKDSKKEETSKKNEKSTKKNNKEDGEKNTSTSTNGKSSSKKTSSSSTGNSSNKGTASTNKGNSSSSGSSSSGSTSSNSGNTGNTGQTTKPAPAPKPTPKPEPKPEPTPEPALPKLTVNNFPSYLLGNTGRVFATEAEANTWAEEQINTEGSPWYGAISWDATQPYDGNYSNAGEPDSPWTVNIYLQERYAIVYLFFL